MLNFLKVLESRGSSCSHNSCLPQYRSVRFVVTWYQPHPEQPRSRKGTSAARLKAACRPLQYQAVRQSSCLATSLALILRIASLHQQRCALPTGHASPKHFPAENLGYRLTSLFLVAGMNLVLYSALVPVWKAQSKALPRRDGSNTAGHCGVSTRCPFARHPV